MKKTLLFMIVLGFSLAITAQTKLDFESDAIGATTNAAALWAGGSVDVMANPYKTGMNTSNQVLHVMNDNYCAVYLKIALPAGTKTSYPYISVNYKLCYVGPNGGDDLNYPNTDFYSIPSSSTSYADANTSPDVMRFASSIGWSGVCWGSATVGTWTQSSFTFPSATLTNIPEGYLVIKIAKPKLEYLIDDIELVPSPTSGTDIYTLENYEARTIDEVLTTSGSGATASVKANPTDAAQKSAEVIPTDYGNYLRLNAVLPAGKVLSNYDRLYFDIYIANSSTVYKQMVIKANSTTIYQDSDYPSQGTNNVWQYRNYDLSKLDLSAVTGNTFTLDLGLNTNTDVAKYYIDNVKLHENVIAAVDNQQVNPLIVTCNGNLIRLNMIVDKVELLDLNGRLILGQKNIKEINVSNLSSGVYIVKSLLAGKTYVTKVVK
ncbi:exported hypothetical protein [uncultured Paludibacter sp.]|uniref:Uncharacterized protein n=1 Tax=uncultured Paludibacter sp. TaxID=497635 RepID=A0A653AK16_9BACT|nr:exported hypothetical protein [uncultured Paludibacter sp.]